MKDLPNKNKKQVSGGDPLRYAYRLLSYRDRSEKELRGRFQKKGFSEDDIESVISRLREKGFINDRSLALSLKKSAEDVKLLGTMGTRWFLHRRGIAENIIDDVVEENESEESERAYRLVEKKMRSMQRFSADEVKKKLWRFLMSKGYSFDTIRKTLKSFKMEEEA